jgi:hypothetical protein
MAILVLASNKVSAQTAPEVMLLHKSTNTVKVVDNKGTIK